MIRKIQSVNAYIIKFGRGFEQLNIYIFKYLFFKAGCWITPSSIIYIERVNDLLVLVFELSALFSDLSILCVWRRRNRQRILCWENMEVLKIKSVVTWRLKEWLVSHLFIFISFYTGDPNYVIQIDHSRIVNFYIILKEKCFQKGRKRKEEEINFRCVMSHVSYLTQNIVSIRCFTNNMS